MKRNLTMALLFALTLLLALPATADSSDVFCGDLPAGDCQLLRDAAANMDALSSMAFDMRLTLAFDAYGESSEIALGASGSLAMSPESLEAAKSAADFESMTLDEDMAATLDGLIAGLSGAIDLDIALPEEEGMALSLLIKDGVIVLDMSALGALMGEGDAAESEELFGLDANGIFSYLAADPSMSEHMMTGEADASLEDATSITRLPDGEVNGLSVAVFESEIGSNALFADMGAELANSVAGADYASYDSISLTMREYIGLDDQRTHRVEASMATEGDMGMTLQLWLDMSAFNQPVNVSLPEDVMAFPLAMMMQMMAAESDG